MTTVVKNSSGTAFRSTNIESLVPEPLREVRHFAEQTNCMVRQGDISKYLVYLDWNVIVSLSKGDLGELATELKQQRESGRIVVPFSETHGYEACNHSNADPEQYARHKADGLSALEKHTDVQEITDDEDRIHFWNNRSATQAFAAVHDLHIMNTIVQRSKWWFEITRNEMLKYGLDPKFLNNVPTEEVLDRIDAILRLPDNMARYAHLAPNGITFKELLVMGLQPLNLKGQGLVRAMVASLHTSLDLLGYSADRRDERTAVSQFLDADHAYWGMHSDCFITDDLRLRRKAAVIYNFCGSESLTFSSTQALAWLRSL